MSENKKFFRASAEDIKKIPDVQQLLEKICGAIDRSRAYVSTAINTAMVYTYFEIGRYIVEDEQNGANRAEYGKAILKNLSVRLYERYGQGWTEDTLKRARYFYKVYSDREIWATPLPELACHGSDGISQIAFTLSWSHYLVLMRIENADERSFYEIECTKSKWSVRQLQRQVASSLYERLALSRDKRGVMKLAEKGQTIETPSDIIKNPLSLEFLGLEHSMRYSENKLETAIIDKLGHFLLELGKGFLFEARQKRFTFNEKHFFVDLVFYNRLLRSYVLIDLKTDEITHQDLGQMQMYVNYFDRYVRLQNENPTIGILLCGKKDDELVKLTLPENANIFAQEYSLYLPDKQLLQRKLREWIAENEELGMRN